MEHRAADILCSILRDSLSKRERKDIVGMSAEDWSSVYKMTRHNNLLPLLYHKLHFHEITSPAALQARLRTDYMAYEVRDLQRRRQLRELIRIFNDHSIDHMLLKGSHLAEKVYRNSLFRHMCDIDVLIRKCDFSFAYGTLIKYGYVSSRPNHHDTELLALDKHYPELVKAGCLPVELHWNVHSQYDHENIESIWARSENVLVDGLKTKVLSPEEIGRAHV